MSTVKAIHVNVYGTVLEVDFDSHRSPYEVSKEFIGDWTERVNVLQIGEDQMLAMWVDDSGHLKGLAVNELASRFYPAPGTGFPPGNPPITGDVIFTLLKQVWTNEGPDWKVIDLNDEARKALRAQGVSA